MEIFRTALRSLLSNRTRSILTMLGIIIGVGAVITMVAIGNGASQQMQEMIAGFGSNLIIVSPAPPNTTGARAKAGSGASLTLSDSEAIASEGFAVLRTAPEVSGTAQAVYRNNNWNTSITGGTPDLLPVRTWELNRGVCFSDADVRSGAKVCVIGPTVAKELFGYANPVNSTIRIRNIPFKVSGVMKSKGANSFGLDQDDFILVPITTAQRRLFRSGTRVDSVNRINVQAKTRELLDTATEETKAILRQRHRIAKGAGDDFDIRDLTQSLESAASMSALMSLLLGAIASISLVVGGIGIMNIMLVSVSERTREIGIRMAIGARPSNVRMQFLTEAVVLSLLGGAVGIMIGWGISIAASAVLPFGAIVSLNSVFIAVGFSAGVGIFFGFWPAWKASNLDPIVALRAD